MRRCNKVSHQRAIFEDGGPVLRSQDTGKLLCSVQANLTKPLLGSCYKGLTNSSPSMAQESAGKHRRRGISPGSSCQSAWMAGSWSTRAVRAMIESDAGSTNSQMWSKTSVMSGIACMVESRDVRYQESTT